MAYKMESLVKLSKFKIEKHMECKTESKEWDAGFWFYFNMFHLKLSYLLGYPQLSQQPPQVSTDSNSLKLGTLPCSAQQDAFL